MPASRPRAQARRARVSRLLPWRYESSHNVPPRPAKEIKSLISASGDHVRTGVDLVSKTGAALNEIVTQVQQINRNVGAIVTSAQPRTIHRACGDQCRREPDGSGDAAKMRRWSSNRRRQAMGLPSRSRRSTRFWRSSGSGRTPGLRYSRQALQMLPPPRPLAPSAAGSLRPLEARHRAQTGGQIGRSSDRFQESETDAGLLMAVRRPSS